MFRFKKVVGVAALVTIVAALGIASIASAQTATPPATPNSSTVPAAPRGGSGFGHGGLHSQAALDAAAKALGMTADELSAQLWGGKTLADIATAKGVDIATVQKAVQAAMVTETKTAIAQAVTDGTITQAKADWLTEGLDKGYWGPAADGFGFGMGPGMGPGGFEMRRGGPGGLGGFGAPNGAAPNSTSPNSTSPNSSTTPSGSNF